MFENFKRNIIQNDFFLIKAICDDLGSILILQLLSFAKLDSFQVFAFEGWNHEGKLPKSGAVQTKITCIKPRAITPKRGTDSDR